MLKKIKNLNQKCQKNIRNLNQKVKKIKNILRNKRQVHSGEMTPESFQVLRNKIVVTVFFFL